MNYKLHNSETLHLINSTLVQHNFKKTQIFLNLSKGSIANSNPINVLDESYHNIPSFKGPKVKFIVIETGGFVKRMILGENYRQ